jgi:phosphoserine phosphatase
MVTRVILVRHGRSTYNAEKRYQGCCDESVLTENGFTTALLTGDFLRDVQIDAVYCSPLRRTQQSAISILSKLETKLDFECHEALKEIAMPDWEGLSFKYVRQNFELDYQCWKERPHKFQMQRSDQFIGSLATLAEPFFPVLELYSQAEQFWEEILPQHLDETILIVSHGGTIRALIGTAIGMNSKSFHTAVELWCQCSRVSAWFTATCSA